MILMKNDKFVDKKPSIQVRIDSGLHQLLKLKAKTSGTSIKALVEGCLADLLGVDYDN